MNRLAAETSPYLLQHAENPVDWYPWGPEALERARSEEKPILLSVGYSACHWCHVMAHESFESDGDGGGDERALRQRQGRPRGAARRRRALHGRDRLDDRPGRLADDRLPHAGGRAVLRRHVLPAGAAARPAVVSPSSCSRWPRPGRRSGTTSSRRRDGSSRRRATRPGSSRPPSRSPRRCSTRPSAGSRARSSPSTAASAGRPSSRPPRRSSSSSAAARRRRWRW